MFMQYPPTVNCSKTYNPCLCIDLISLLYGTCIEYHIEIITNWVGRQSVEKYAKMLREKDLKVTSQRLEVLKFLDENRSHPTADGIYRALRKRNPSLSKTTVYNVLWRAGNQNLPFRYCGCTTFQQSFLGEQG